MIIPAIKIVSNSCNLACRYCYYRYRKRGNIVMGDQTLKTIIQKFLDYDSDEKIHFVWHGGEPLLAELKTFEKIIKWETELNYRNKKIINGIQTNATLLNREWARFFKDNNFSVGISIDGPEEIHNFNRPSVSKNNSLSMSLSGLKFLQNENIFPSAIGVLTQKSLGRAKEIFDFYIENKIKKFHLKPCCESDKTGQMTKYSITPDEYTDFMIEIFDLWMGKNDPTIEVRSLLQIVKGILGGTPRLCEFSGRCQLFLTIEHDGTIGACDSFPLQTYAMGNIQSETMEAILNSEGYNRFVSDIQQNKTSCAECEWWKICHGGCLKYSFDASGWRKNTFCDSRKRLFSYIQHRINDIKTAG